VKISAKGNAVLAHFQHGDGFPGRPVPELDGYRFSDDCVPEVDLCFTSVIRAETPTGEVGVVVVILNDPWMDDWRAEVVGLDGGPVQVGIPGDMLPNEFWVGVWSGDDATTLFIDPSMRIECGTLIDLP
jgi:hypothetical protein